MSYYKGLSLDGQKALVFGGTSGLGKAIALGLAEAGAELFVSQVEELGEFERILILARRERGFVARRHAVVPGANVLAHVAAEYPVAHSCAERFRDLLSMLDRQVADALRGVEHVGLWKGVCGTRIETGSARAAVICRVRFVVRQLLVG